MAEAFSLLVAIGVVGAAVFVVSKEDIGVGEKIFTVALAGIVLYKVFTWE